MSIRGPYRREFSARGKQRLLPGFFQEFYIAELRTSRREDYLNPSHPVMNILPLIIHALRSPTNWACACQSVDSVGQFWAKCKCAVDNSIDVTLPCTASIYIVVIWGFSDLAPEAPIDLEDVNHYGHELVLKRQ